MESNELKYEFLSNDFMKHDISFKAIVIGNSGVGKSSITMKATKNTFNDKYLSTVGMDFSVCNIKVEDKVIKLQIWDTCGQELYRSIVHSFFKLSALVILVYAINDYEDLDSWLSDVKENTECLAKVFLIGNKLDLEESRQVSREEGEEFMRKHNLDYFDEVSAMQSIGIKDIFINGAKQLYHEYIKLENEVNIFDHSSKISTSSKSVKLVERSHIDHPLSTNSYRSCNC